MNNQLLETEIAHFEGKSLTVYADTMGLPTVGIGHMDRTMTIGDTITEEQCSAYFSSDINEATNTANRYINLSNQDDVYARIAVQLAFNLGNKLSEFVHFTAAYNAKDYEAAASDLEQSLWYTQVGSRGPATTAAIRNGAYDFE